MGSCPREGPFPRYMGFPQSPWPRVPAPLGHALHTASCWPAVVPSVSYSTHPLSPAPNLGPILPPSTLPAAPPSHHAIHSPFLLYPLGPSSLFPSSVKPFPTPSKEQKPTEDEAKRKDLSKRASISRHPGQQCSQLSTKDKDHRWRDGPEPKLARLPSPFFAARHRGEGPPTAP